MIQGRGDTNTSPAILKVNLSIDFIKVKEVLTNSGLSKNCGKNCDFSFQMVFSIIAA